MRLDVSHYTAPIENMNFVLFDVLNAGQLANFPQFEDATEDMFKAVMDEAAKLAERVMLPVNASGDREGCHFNPEDFSVKTP